MNVTDDLQEDYLRIVPIDRPGIHDDSAVRLAALVGEIERVPPDCGLIVVDNISSLAVIAEDRAIMGFFTSCQRLCSEGKTILVMAQTAAFDQHLTRRLHGMCNNHISIGMEIFRQKFVNVLQVLKAGNVDLRNENRISFNITPEVGITVIPMSRVSV